MKRPSKLLHGRSDHVASGAGAVRLTALRFRGCESGSTGQRLDSVKPVPAERPLE